MNTNPLLFEYELLNSSPERVYDFYKKLIEDKIYDAVDEETEKKLIEKNEPLVLSAISRHTSNKESIRDIFSQAIKENNLPLKIACLSNNRHIGLFGIPFILFEKHSRSTLEEDNNELLEYLKTASYYELRELFRNEKISDFLEVFLSAEDYWNHLNEDTRFTAIRELSFNKIISKPPNVFGHYGSYGLVYRKMWELAEKVDTTPRWAIYLSDLYDKMDYVAPWDIELILNRWRIKDEDGDLNSIGQLNNYGRIRFHLYRGFIKNNKLELHTDSPWKSDLAYRAALYAFTKISSDQIEKAYEEDGKMACEYLSENKKIWSNSKTRNSLRIICRNEEVHSLSYDGLEKEFEKNNPEWFEDDTDEVMKVDENELPVTLVKIRDLLEQERKNVAELVEEKLEEVVDLKIADIGKSFYSIVIVGVCFGFLYLLLDKLGFKW